MKQTTHSVRDIERNVIDEAHLTNTTIRSLAWRDITVEERSRMTDARPTPILLNIDGYAEAGTLIQHSETKFALKQIRNTHRPNGTFG